MIKYKVKENGSVELETSGSLFNLITGSAYLIRSVYTELKEKDEEAAEIYKSAIQATIASDESPVWKAEE